MALSVDSAPASVSDPVALTSYMLFLKPYFLLTRRIIV